MPKMKAIKSHRFGLKTMEPGDLYDATESEAQTVRALGWAQDYEVNGADHRTRRVYRRRDMTAE